MLRTQWAACLLCYHVSLSHTQEHKSLFLYSCKENICRECVLLVGRKSTHFPQREMTIPEKREKIPNLENLMQRDLFFFSALVWSTETALPES